MNEKLFGDIFEQPRIKTPKDVLELFSEKLREESNSALFAEIIPLNTNEKFMTFSFGIKSAITSYTYNLFAIKYGVLMYPCLVSTSDEIIHGTDLVQRNGYNGDFGYSHEGITTQNEEDFTEVIKQILTSERSKSIIRAIYSQK